MTPDPKLVMDMVERARPLFAGQNPVVVGAALADLTAIWLAGHVVRGNKAETDRVRGKLLLNHVEAVRQLTDINEEGLD